MQLIKLFPIRGNPPPDQPGYIRDPGQPFVFRMEWIPCNSRITLTLCPSCPGSVIENQCKYFNKQVDQNVCKACGGIDAITKRLSQNRPTDPVLSNGIYENLIDGLLSELPGLPTQDFGHHEGESMPYVQ